MIKTTTILLNNSILILFSFLVWVLKELKNLWNREKFRIGSERRIDMNFFCSYEF